MKRKPGIRITDEMEGKVCLVTGASGGIGFHVARELAQKGAEVVLASHDRERGEEASRKINAFIMKKAADFMPVDLSSREQIRAFTETFKEKYDRLDVLVNNAGGKFFRRRETVDGIEMTFALNHLNYFLTTLLLMDRLMASESPRIVNVASEAHRRGQMNFADLQLREKYSGLQAYNQSKLANLLFTYELSRRLADTHITVNALHPGFVHTDLGKQNRLARILLDAIHDLFAQSPEKGARTPVYLAVSPAVEDVTGKYFIDKRQAASSDESYDLASADRLWRISRKLCGLDAASIHAKVAHPPYEVVNA